MTELIQEKNALVRQLTASIKELRHSATTYAQKEQDYKVLLATEALKLRDDGTPATLINTVVYGEKQVAKARFERDVALGVYEANKEAINSIKLQLRLIEGQMSREWNSGNET